MEQCYEYFDCQYTNCIKRGESEPCWEIEGTLCLSHEIKALDGLMKQFANGLECKECQYYKKHNKL